MENLSLNEFLIIQRDLNILELKLFLISLKKKGVVFFKEELSSLSTDEPFEFYYYALKGSITYKNAFPIPRHIFNGYPKLTQSISGYWYENYYKSSYNSNLKDFQGMYVGEHYIWIYKIHGSRDDDSNARRF